MPETETNKDNKQWDNNKTGAVERTIGHEWNIIENKERSTSICTYVNMFLVNITKNIVIMYNIF